MKFEKTEISDKSSQVFCTEKMETQNSNSRRWDLFNFDVPRASFVKHLQNKKTSEKEKNYSN